MRVPGLNGPDREQCAPSVRRILYKADQQWQLLALPGMLEELDPILSDGFVVEKNVVQGQMVDEAVARKARRILIAAGEPVSGGGSLN